MSTYTYSTLLDLQRIPGFAALNMPQILSVVHGGRRERIKRGTVLTEEDTVPTLMWVVVNGSVRVQRSGEEDVVLASPVDVGLIRLLAASPAGPRAVAETRLTAVRITAEHVHDVLDASPSHRLASAAELARVVLARRDGVPLLPGPPIEFRGGDDQEGRFAEALVHLQHTAPTAGASVAQLVSFGRALERFEVAAGSEVFADPTKACILVDGTVACSRPGGRVEVGPGTHLGWVHALADVDFDWTANALTPVRGLRYDRTALLAAVRHWPAVGRVVLRHLARAFIDTSPRTAL